MSVNKFEIRQVVPNIGEEEYRELKNCFDSNWITEGPYSRRLLEDFNMYTGARFSVFASTGTLGLYLALKALDLPPGSKVLVSNFTFFGSASSIVMAGLEPVFVEVDSSDYQICTEGIYFHLENSKDISAVMIPHIYGGINSKIVEIVERCKSKGIRVIEDAAQAVGVFLDDVHAGNFGDISMFSFYGDKTVTMGEGAIVVTSDLKLYEKLCYIRNQGRLHSGTFIHDEIGMNFRITDMQAAVGYIQFKKIEEIVKQRREIFQLYISQINSVEFINTISYGENVRYVPFRFPILFANELDRKRVEKMLNDSGVETRRFFYPMNLQPSLRLFSVKPCLCHCNRANCCDASLRLYNNGLCLPVHHKIGVEEVNYIFEQIKKYFQDVR